MRNNFKVSFFNKLRMNFGGGYLADQYVLYDLKNNDKRDYLSEFDWYKSRYINEPFDVAFNNKVISNEIIKQYAKVPQTYYIKKPKGAIFDFNSNIVSVKKIYDCLKEKKKLILKPINLGQGNGVHIIGYESNEVYIDDIKCSNKELFEFLNRLDNFFICEYMYQHEYAQELYDKTANTIRIIAIRGIENHSFKLIHAVQRIGTSETAPVDNASKGGLVSKIDMENGIMSEARSLQELGEFYTHPDNGNIIAGIKIPMWSEIKNEILDLSNKFPYMNLIAWDILVQDDGWCVIEANTSSGVNILQLWEGQRKLEFGAFLKAYRIIK